MGELLYGEITERIIGASYVVHNTLGKNLSESVYHNALVAQLLRLALHVEVEKVVPLFFDNVKIGWEELDILVEGRIVVEVKALRKISSAHMNKLLATLRNTKYPLGIIINFGPSVQVKRVINSVQRT